MAKSDLIKLLSLFVEIKEQVLPDGSHISRSPQATFEFFKDLVDLRVALIAARIEMPDELQHAIDRMAPAVKFFRHPDGTLAHFNGAQEGNAHLCETTVMHSARVKLCGLYHMADMSAFSWAVRWC